MTYEYRRNTTCLEAARMLEWDATRDLTPLHDIFLANVRDHSRNDGSNMYPSPETVAKAWIQSQLPAGAGEVSEVSAAQGGYYYTMSPRTEPAGEHEWPNVLLASLVIGAIVALCWALVLLARS